MKEELKIEMLDVLKIRIVNPRSRDSKKYAEIVNSIKSLGLKVPIVVAEKRDEHGNTNYDLVCGEGRLNAYKANDETYIPARIIQAGTEDLLLMSLVENLARQQINKTALISELMRLSAEGYTYTEISKKVGFSINYISSVMKLASRKESKLLQAVLSGKMNISTAITIADCSDDEAVQKIISESYTKGKIKAGELRYISRIVKSRKEGNSKRTPITKEKEFIAIYKKEMDEGFAFLRKAEICSRNLAYIRGAFNKILSDECFVNLLVAQDIGSIPAEISMEVSYELTN
jgi:ParB-like partition proteins